MLNKNRYWKSLLGQFADVLIAKQIDYSGTGASTVTNFPTFVSAALEGEFAFFNADTLALIAGTTSGSPAAVTAVGSTVKIFGAVKRNGLVEKTLTFTVGGYNNRRTAYAAAAAQVSKATFSGTPVVNHYYAVKIMETTPGSQPFPIWEYGVTATAAESLASVLTRITALINSTTNITNVGTDPIVTATFDTATITITANAGGPTFRVVFSVQAIEELTAAAVYTGGGTTQASWGSGTYAQIAELEFESDVYKGITTQYPEQGATAADYGAPTAFATVGATYNLYILTGVKTEMSPTPVDQHQQAHTIILAIPSNGAANAEAEVKGILGL